MAKGVKKIKYIKGLIYPDMSVPNVRLTIKPDQWVWFVVSEWEAETTDKDKGRKLTWFRQSTDRKIILNKQHTDFNDSYGLRLPKKLCGSYHYYIEASLFGERDFRKQTGLYVKGWCTPKIVSSKWSKIYNGDDVRKTYQFSYGEDIFLHLETEGLNGDKIGIEIYRQKQGGRGTLDDQLIHIITNVQVIDGEINLKIGNTYQWYGKIGVPKGKEEFYVKVKTIKGQYITDGKDSVHARYLRVKNSIVSKKTEIPTNITPVKVGQVSNNVKNNHICRFNSIEINDNGENFWVFNEGYTSFEKVTSNTQFTNINIYFKSNKSDLEAEAKNTLKSILDFFLRNLHLDMLLSGYTDSIGSLEDNQKLSEARTRAVLDFLVKGGLDKNKIRIRNFGKAYSNIEQTEKERQKSRRVEINFSYLEYNQNAIIYETVTGGTSREITVNVIKHSAGKACFREEKHKHKNEIRVNGIAKSGDTISYPISNHLQKDFPKNYASLLLNFLNPLPTSIIYGSYNIYINSCAYYADKDKATIVVRTYPDVVWIAHFQYNYQDSGTYFFHNKTFDDLSVGITDVLNELQQTISYKIWRVLPSNFIYEQTVLKYIEEQAKSYVYGLHTFHNRSIEKVGQELSLEGTKTNIITQTSYAKYMAAIAIYEFVVIGILIDLLMIYLTRGRNLTGKIKKISKKAKEIKKTIDKIKKRADENNIEIIPPSIAINAGMYYQKQKDNRLALVYEANIKASPLIAIDFEREFDLLEMLMKENELKDTKLPNDPETLRKLERNKKNKQKILNAIGLQKVKGSFKVKGEIIFEHNVKFQVLQGKAKLLEIIGDGIATAKDERILTQQITMNAFVDMKFRKDFRFDPLQTKIEAKAKTELKGATAVKVKYGVNENKGLFIEKKLIFYGIEGSFLGKIKKSTKFLGKIISDTEYETNNGKPIYFTLIEPFEITLYKVQLFNIEKK